MELKAKLIFIDPFKFVDVGIHSMELKVLSQQLLLLLLQSKNPFNGIESSAFVLGAAGGVLSLAESIQWN